jgi:hypothetical protein
VWGTGWKFLIVIGLNPSTADEIEDDPTIRRCIRYAKDWGFDGLRMLNLFALRSTDPRKLSEVVDPVGPLNNAYLKAMAGSITLCAWGANKFAHDRAREVLDLLAARDLYVLGFTKDGAPRHPLYMKADIKPIKWDTLA